MEGGIALDPGLTGAGDAAGQPVLPNRAAESEESARDLLDVTAQQRVACARFFQSIGRDLTGNGLHLGQGFATRQAELTCLLLSHVLAGRSARLRGMYARRQPHTPPLPGTSAATRAIFLQAARAIPWRST